MRFALIAAATVVTSTALARDVAMQDPAETPIIGGATSQGCFSATSGDKTELRTSRLTTGSCFEKCMKEGEDFTVAVLGPSKCYCGHEYPPKDALVDDESCSFPCPAYPMQACGGVSTVGKNGEKTGYFSVWNLGVEVDVPYAKAGANEEEEPKEDDAEGDKDEEGNEDKHHSPTALWTASETASKTASETASKTSSTPSTTPGSNGSEDNDDADDTTEQTSSSTTTTPTPVASDPADGAAAVRVFNIGAVAGSVVVAIAVAGIL